LVLLQREKLPLILILYLFKFQFLLKVNRKNILAISDLTGKGQAMMRPRLAQWIELVGQTLAIKVVYGVR